MEQNKQKEDKTKQRKTIQVKTNKANKNKTEKRKRIGCEIIIKGNHIKEAKTSENKNKIYILKQEDKKTKTKRT